MSADSAAQVIARLRELRARTETAAPRAAVTAMSLAVVKAAQLELTRKTHRAGTPTPSAPGEPPALVTGTLRRSVIATPPEPAGPARWTASAGGTVVYARIQELGGQAGRGSLLPARPYLRPATQALTESGALSRIAAEAYLAALTA